MISDVPSEIFSTIPLERPVGRRIPKQRLKDAWRAQQVVWTLINANQNRSSQCARLQGMLDGNAPFDNAELVKQGQANRANFNAREGASMLAGSEQPYYDLFAESSTYCQIEVEEDDSQKRSDYSRKITGYFDDMLKKWSGFDYNIQRAIHDMVAFGPGFLVWPDATSWMSTAIRHSQVLVPDGTVADPDQLELLIIRQEQSVSDLYGKIMDPESATAVGWNVNAVLDAISAAQPSTSTDVATQDYERVQEELRNHDIYTSTRSDVIRVANVYVREFNGKISHLIVEERNALTNRAYPGRAVDPKDLTSTKFLYKKVARYNCFREVVNPFFFSIGNGTWHSIKGLGVELYNFIEIKNRLICSIIDNAFINLSVLMQAGSGRSEQETALMQLGPLTILPANFEIRQWGLAGRMEEGLAVEQNMTNRLENNTGQYKRPQMKTQGNPDTATKVNYDAIKEASLNKGAVNRFYAQLDNFFEETYRRATNFNLVPEQNGRGPNCMAIEFQEKCLKAGVPKKCLKAIRYVRASRNAGNGSVFLRQQVVTQTAQLVPMLNEQGKQNWLDDSIAVLAGTENVDRWNPKQVIDANMQNEQAFAMLENNALAEGSPVRLTSTQNDLVHASTHLQAATEAINAIQKGGDPMRVLGFLESVGPHIGLHVQRLAGDVMRGKEYKILVDQLKQLGKITDQIKSKVEAQQQQQQQAMQAQQQEMARQQQKTQDVLTDGQLKQIKTQTDLQLSRAKADSRMTMSRERHDVDLALKQQKASQDITIKDALASTDIRSTTAKTVAEIETKKAKAVDTSSKQE